MAPSTTVTAALQPVTSRENVTLTVTVTEPDAAVPAGEVEFLNGTTSLGTAATATTLAVAADSGPAYGSVTPTGAVANSAESTVIPVGSCDFLDGVTSVGTAPVGASGVWLLLDGVRLGCALLPSRVHPHRRQPVHLLAVTRGDRHLRSCADRLSMPANAAAGVVFGAERTAVPRDGTVTEPGAGATCSFASAASEGTAVTCTDDGTSTLALPVSVNAGRCDTQTCSIEWGDRTDTAAVVDAGRCTASHTYTSTGVYTVVVTVSVDGGTGSDEVVLVVSDRAAKVTGGGCILGSGRTSFGFVAKQPASGDLSGQLQVQTLGGHRFRGDIVDSLTVSGNTATWTGTGSWDGADGYTYVVHVADDTVVVPAGELSIFTPCSPTAPFDMGNMVLAADGSSFSASARFDGVTVTVTDTRAGTPGWTASLIRSDFVGSSGTILAKHSGFVNVTPGYLIGNPIQDGDVTVHEIPPPTAPLTRRVRRPSPPRRRAPAPAPSTSSRPSCSRVSRPLPSPVCAPPR